MPEMLRENDIKAKHIMELAMMRREQGSKQCKKQRNEHHPRYGYGATPHFAASAASTGAKFT
jgi:hypothetical protein